MQESDEQNRIFQFNNGLKELICNNTDKMTHLDLSNMVSIFKKAEGEFFTDSSNLKKVLFIDEILEYVGSYSKSL